MSAPHVYPRVGKSQLRPPVLACEIFPWLDEEVEEALLAGWESGIRDPCGLALMALSGVYAVTPEGQDLVWPAVPGDCGNILALEERMGYRARLFVACCEDEEATHVWKEAGGR